jgi:peptidase M50-like protein
MPMGTTAHQGRHRRGDDEDAPHDLRVVLERMLQPLTVWSVIILCEALSRRYFLAPPKHTGVLTAVAAILGLVLAAVVIGVVVHELGHALAVVLAGRRLIAIYLGGPPVPLKFQLGRVDVGIGWRPGGRVGYDGNRMSAGRRAFITAAGPVAVLLSAPLFLLLPIPRWVAWYLVILLVIDGVTDFRPVRTTSGMCSDGLMLLSIPARRRAAADVRMLLDTPGWTELPGAADRLLDGWRLDVPAAEECVSQLAGQVDDLVRLYGQSWTLPASPNDDFVKVVHHLSWQVLTIPGLPGEAANLAATRVDWVLEKLGEGSDLMRSNVRHSLAVARLRQGRAAEVEPLCAGILGEELKPDDRATVLATVAMARRALGQPGRAELDEALSLDPEADLVGEALLATSLPAV